MKMQHFNTKKTSFSKCSFWIDNKPRTTNDTIRNCPQMTALSVAIKLDNYIFISAEQHPVYIFLIIRNKIISLVLCPIQPLISNKNTSFSDES